MKKQIVLIGFFLSLLIMGFVIGANAQTKVTKDSTGNYVMVRAIKPVAKETGQTYMDAKGNIFPVYISKNGKLFIIRTSKNGNQYNQYLSVE